MTENAVEAPLPGQWFLDARGVLQGQIWIAADSELTEDEIDEFYSGPI